MNGKGQNSNMADIDCTTFACTILHSRVQNALENPKRGF